MTRQNVVLRKVNNRARWIHQKSQNDRKEGWAKRNESLIKLTLSVFGIIIGVNEYLQRQHDNRVQQSLSIIERYQSKDVLQARLRIDRRWNNTEFWKEITERHDEDGRLYYEYMEDIAARFVEDREAVDDLFIVWTTSTEASLCLDRGQCDQFTICTNFFHDTQKYFYFFRPYFDAKAFAWDEQIQALDVYTVSVVNDYCGNLRYMELYNTPCEEGSGLACKVGKFFKKYIHETFNNPVGV